MLTRLSLVAFLLAHAAIHVAFVSPRPRATAGGPAWPFELGRSWILGPLGIDPEVGRILGVALVAVTIGGFVMAALAAAGLVPAGLWSMGVTIGAIASIAVLAVFFHPWLVLGVAIDLTLLWTVLVANWAPEGA